jgi:hypothetical protein
VERASVAAWSGLLRGLFQLPVRDIDCEFKLIRRAVLQRFELQGSEALIGAELVIRCRAEGARFTEIGVHHHPARRHDHRDGKGVSLAAGVELARAYRRLHAAAARASHR